ncbi:hypothetical protein ACIRN4_06185 [Pimelobacter simplex]|uniref:hypothetical protein n=1 Tax=Nocardioides simplex TaxID=2045 RepID=UPI0037F756B8
MTAPPGRRACTSEPRVEQISAESDTDLSTRTGQVRYLVRGLGISRRQAHALLRAYELDQRDRQARQASADEFGNWLRSNYWPSVSRRPRPNMATGWAVRSS